MSFGKNISTLKLPHHKQTSGMASEPITPSAEVLLPMNMHSGQAAVPVVEVGQHVYRGQLIAREEGKNSSPVHASVSGTVKAIEPYGRTQAIRIESDGRMEADPELKAPDVHDLDSFLQAVRESAIVGLGGAAFPVWAKLDAVRRNKIKTVLINGAECEPYITSDDRTMVEHSELIKQGVALLKQYLGSEEFIIGIEKNKPAAIAELERTFADEPAVTVKPLKSVYPQGAKQVLLYNATGKVVGPGQRLASLGVIIINVTSLTKVAQYMNDGMPLVEKTVTVDGSAVAKPKNVIVPIGMKLADVFEQSGGFCAEPKKVLYGGPMMGIAVPDLEQPVLKNTNAVLAMSEADAVLPEPSACIRCGRCIRHCPLRLMPSHIVAAYEAGNMERLAELKVNLCMECGCCSFGCPAHRPLVQTNKLAKAKLAAWRKAQSEKLDATKEAVK